MVAFDAQTRMDPGASFVSDGAGPVLSARVAEERDCTLGQELTEAAERVHADLAHKAKVREFGAWEQFKVSSPAKLRARSKDMVNTGWVLT